MRQANERLHGFCIQKVGRRGRVRLPVVLVFMDSANRAAGKAGDQPAFRFVCRRHLLRLQYTRAPGNKAFSASYKRDSRKRFVALFRRVARRAQTQAARGIGWILLNHHAVRRAGGIHALVIQKHAHAVRRREGNNALDAIQKRVRKITQGFGHADARMQYHRANAVRKKVIQLSFKLPVVQVAV